MIRWMLVALVLLGDTLVVFKHRLGFLTWILVDGYFAIENAYHGDAVQATVFSLYSIIGIYGLYKWR